MKSTSTRVNPSHLVNGAIPVLEDPARRADVLLRVRKPEGWEPSPWWSVGAFLAVTAIVVFTLGFIPGDISP